MDLVYLPRLSVDCIKRCRLTVEQASRADLSNKSLCYLFEISLSRAFPLSIEVPGVREFRFMLTGARDILESRQWKDLPDMYAFLRE